MKYVDPKCPNCGASVDPSDGNYTYCQYCGAKLTADDEMQGFKIANSEEAGYQFEKGRQRAQSEAANTTTMYPPQKPKRKTWLWVLGWIFIFPLPLTLILIKKQDMNKMLKYGIIAAAWLVYLIIGCSGMGSGGKTDTKSAAQETTVAVQETTEEETTEEPTEEETTEAPTEKVTEVRTTEAVIPINVVSYTAQVDAGANASLTISAAPNTEYDIDVQYSSGESNAAGLEPKYTDGNGNATWEWEVGTNTKPGTYSITVSGGNNTIRTEFTVK